jgi:hypothetical protein
MLHKMGLHAVSITTALAVAIVALTLVAHSGLKAPDLAPVAYASEFHR